MAVAIASAATATAEGADTVVVTAPASIATGDTLLIIATSSRETSTMTSPNFTESFSYKVGGLSGRRGNITVLYKTAVSADETASNYTITNDGTGLGPIGGVVMYRITGAVTGDPVFSRATSNDFLSTSGGLDVDETVSLERPSQQLNFIVASAFCPSALSPGDISVSSYEIVSTDSNPTWTESIDTSFNVSDTQSWDANFAVAYAASTDTSTVTGYKFDYSEVSLDEPSLGMWAYFTVLSPSAASGTNTLTEATAESFQASGVTNTSGNVVLTEATAEALTQTGTGKAPTQWTNEAKPSTTWVNETK
jgi:hypothetical protein